MEGLLAFIPIALLLLACPLMMVGMGAGAWLWARAKGEKKEFSMGCMGGQCSHEEHAAKPEEGSVKEEVARLQQEVQALRGQVAGGAGGNGVRRADPVSAKEERPAA